VVLPERGDTPPLEKLWARERIRDLERADLTGRRAKSNEKRIIKLALEHQLVTQFTSFLVIEHRQGDRLASGQPETRVIPVNVPAGWDMFRRIAIPQPRLSSVAVFGVAASASASFEAKASPTMARIAPREPRPGAVDLDIGTTVGADPARSILERQLASGLWQPDGGADDVARALATARALLELLDCGVTTSHPTHGAQVRKAVAALVLLLPQIARAHEAAAEFAAAVAWLVATGPRSRAVVEDALVKEDGLKALRSSFKGDVALRARVDELGARLAVPKS
jgi:Ca-activated chloride channel family protein